MNNIHETYPQGYWSVGSNNYINKLEAEVKSIKTSTPIKFHFFDGVWESVDMSLLGKFDLDSLYKYRALQLRDTYDYLILYFSGGADSYNVLRSFIDNDIHLDEICVKWSMAVHKSNVKIYNPTTQITDSTNTLSEWDYAITPVLEYIKNFYPQIKINIVDWLPDINKPLTYDQFKKVNHWHDLELPIMTSYSESEKSLANKGKTVGAIYGVDKPNVAFVKNNAYTWFSDSATTMGVPDLENPFVTVEYFYWSPNFPLLALEMARVCAIWQLGNKHVFDKSAITEPLIEKIKQGNFRFFEFYQYKQTHIRSVIYSTWNNNFQAGKPFSNDRADKHPWLFDHDQLKTYRDSYYSIMNEMPNAIDNTVGKRCRTKLFLVLENVNQYCNWEI